MTSNLYNRLFHENMNFYGMDIPYTPKNYGLWESEGKEMGIKIVSAQLSDPDKL
ncbi:MAG: hypothetical protein LUF35_00845 [Lachnospiraceae bacterium]|nr:hypothetical protein [Lachnospiraceae bacterium]